MFVASGVNAAGRRQDQSPSHAASRCATSSGSRFCEIVQARMPEPQERVDQLIERDQPSSRLEFDDSFFDVGVGVFAAAALHVHEFVGEGATAFGLGEPPVHPDAGAAEFGQSAGGEARVGDIDVGVVVAEPTPRVPQLHGIGP